ncbi:MAG: hypothetical protein L6Q92_13180 [Phycisphaerae bacterium]|nr:hypothetical protein [Phycisphaerae bacterium]
MPRRSDILMLEVSEHAARIVQVRRAGDAVEFRNAATFGRADAARAGSLALADASVRERLEAHVAAHNGRGSDLVAVISGPTVTCSYFEMPELKAPALRSAVQLKLSQQLDYDVQEAVLCVEPPVSTGESSAPWVGAVAIHRDQARLVTQLCDVLRVRLVAMTAGPSALAEWGRIAAAIEAKGIEAVLSVGERASTLVVYRDGHAFVSSELPLGLADFTRALMRPIIHGDDVIQLDEAGATALRDSVGIPSPDRVIESLNVPSARLLPLLEPVLQQFAKHLTQWLSFARSSGSGASVTRLTLAGPGARIQGLAETLAARLKLATRSTDAAAATIRLSGEFAPELELLAGAFLAQRPLPDLVPPEVRQRQRIERYRRFGESVGPALAATLLLVTLLFRHLTSGLDQAQARDASILEKTQAELRALNEWKAQADRVLAREREIGDFARTSPRWVGIFKELAVLLPTNMQIRQMSARTIEDGLTLQVTAVLYAAQEGVLFDEAVEQTLATLQASPYFSRVEVLSAARADAVARRERQLGTMVVELRLAYPLPQRDGGGRP